VKGHVLKRPGAVTYIMSKFLFNYNKSAILLHNTGRYTQVDSHR